MILEQSISKTNGVRIAADLAGRIEELKSRVVAMLEESRARAAESGVVPGPIWSEVLGVLSYALNLSAEDFLNIRFHTSLITGEPVLTYWHPYPPIDPEVFADRSTYKFFAEAVPQAYWLSEPPTPWIPRPIGVSFRGRTINVNTSRYQSCVSNLYTSGVLNALSRSGQKNVIVEIGGGYGGLANGLGKALLPKATYIIVDLPLTLLFSGGFLLVNNPDKRIYVYEESSFDDRFLESEIYGYDYVLLPNYVLKRLHRLSEINLMINMQSFQEMTRAQVGEYLDFGCSKLDSYIYSDNIDCHPHNKGLAPDTITSLLADRFRLFPEPAFYERGIPPRDDPWFYKCYVGVPKGSELRLPRDAAIRIIADRRYVVEA
ncbi:MAG: putative sugar O-methyltransferase [Actinobacteria bacterium]|nr:putative sugar O-methyltransferase [Actinomycetota bacterium]